MGRSFKDCSQPRLWRGLQWLPVVGRVGRRSTCAELRPRGASGWWRSAKDPLLESQADCKDGSELGLSSWPSSPTSTLSTTSLADLSYVSESASTRCSESDTADWNLAWDDEDSLSSRGSDSNGEDLFFETIQAFRVQASSTFRGWRRRQAVHRAQPRPMALPWPDGTWRPGSPRPDGSIDFSTDSQSSRDSLSRRVRTRARSSVEGRAGDSLTRITL